MGKEVRRRQWNLILRIEQALELLGETKEHGTMQKLSSLLDETQESVRVLKSEIEKLYGGKNSIALQLKRLYEELQFSADVILQGDMSATKRELEQLKATYQSEIANRKEIVFMPYKASMWDALESIWQAAREDKNCDVYVVPLPYYDKNNNGAGGAYHYEGDLFPQNVTIIHYEDYLLEDRMPDVIYIHNPYDWMNNLTTVDPRFYSDELKKYTDCLVYVPYYSTTGGMGEGQERCPAYYNADYIVIQAESYRGFFDKNIPDEKFLALGSPKFDRVIRLCNQPPQAPKEWEDKLRGKRVFFYNTSLSGMLADPENFFEKMEYVFECFRGKDEVCLLWRPHPLFENCITTHLPQYQEKYSKLKTKFLRERLGILDTTPDITTTIALCDVYIGDDGTSVTSLFGVVGKPLFILNNKIHGMPEKDAWRTKVIRPYGSFDDTWKTSEGNGLYYSENSDYQYKFVTRISKYMSGNYYPNAMRYEDKVYLLPAHAQDILVWKKSELRRIPLERRTERLDVFCYAVKDRNRIYLIPRNYPSIVCFDAEVEQVEYIREFDKVYLQNVDGKWKTGGCGQWKEYLLLASPTENKLVMLHKKTRQSREINLNVEHMQGIAMVVPYMDTVWLLPYEGQAIVRWEPLTGQVREYSGFPTGFVAGPKPFSSMAFYNGMVYVAPATANMYLQFGDSEGVVTEWIPPIPTQLQEPKGAFSNVNKTQLCFQEDCQGQETAKLMTLYDRRLYELNLKTGKAEEIDIVYDLDEVAARESGFGRLFDWMRYACREDAYCTLPDLIEGCLVGQAFDKSMQLEAYREINASCDGTAGVRIHEEVQKRL